MEIESSPRNFPEFAIIVGEVLSGIDENSLDHTIEQVLNKYLPPETCPSLHGFDLNGWKKELTAEIDGFGPLNSLLHDPEVTEICINDFDKIYCEKNGQLQLCGEHFSSPLTYQRFVKNFLKLIDKTGDIRHPLVDGVYTLEDGGCDIRIHMSLPPISQTPIVTLRKHAHQDWNLQDLLGQKMFDEKYLLSLKGWIGEKKNILVCGPTGSGKTTFMRAILKECPIAERIVSLEDTAELGSVGDHHVALITRPDPENLVPEVDLSLLLKNTLRMRPDRIVVGEVRGTEALVLLDALSTGHRGAICTLHAHSAQHALKRLESLVLRACSQWSMQAVRQIIVDSIDVVIICAKKDGLRFVSQTALLKGAEDFGYLLQNIE